MDGILIDANPAGRERESAPTKERIERRGVRGVGI